MEGYPNDLCITALAEKPCIHFVPGCWSIASFVTFEDLSIKEGDLRIQRLDRKVVRVLPKHR